MALIIKDGLLVTEDGIIKSDLKIQNEKITEINCSIKELPEDTVISAEGKIVIPGILYENS